MNNKGFIKEVLEPHLDQQYLRSRDRIDPLYSASALRDHDGLQCHFTDHRVYPLWKRVRSKDRVYKRHAAGISGNF